jgi:uncharacterized protein YrzB (UPF0473 family)
MAEKRKITLIDPNNPNTEQICDILLEFNSTVTNRRYILFTPEQHGESQVANVEACIIDRTVNPPKISPIKTAFEWEMIECVFNEYIQGLREGEDSI